MRNSDATLTCDSGERADVQRQCHCLYTGMGTCNNSLSKQGLQYFSLSMRGRAQIGPHDEPMCVWRPTLCISGRSVVSKERAARHSCVGRQDMWYVKRCIALTKTICSRNDFWIECRASLLLPESNRGSEISCLLREPNASSVDLARSLFCFAQSTGRGHQVLPPAVDAASCTCRVCWCLL